jgi:dTDP-4-dehydrorhamnose 3,5-epimerase
VVLEDDTVFAYKVDNYYSPECDRGISYSDEKLGIEWPIALEELKLSQKDTKQPNLHETDDVFEYGVNYYA